MKLHKHKCAHCPRWYDCTLDCSTQSDGEPTCGPCAERRFDEIVPQERVKVKMITEKFQLMESALVFVKECLPDADPLVQAVTAARIADAFWPTLEAERKGKR